MTKDERRGLMLLRELGWHFIPGTNVERAMQVKAAFAWLTRQFKIDDNRRRRRK